MRRWSNSSSGGFESICVDLSSIFTGGGVVALLLGVDFLSEQPS